MSNVKGHIKFQNVSFNYPARQDIPILQGISFEVKPGETVALVGSSGSGKSTTVSLLLRYYNPLSGEICIDGNLIKDININSLRKSIGVVSQEPILFNCSIEENIKYGNDDITDNEMRDACRMANAENFITSLPLGYKTMVGERGVQLSGGQKQRIAIARALVRKPKILLLDEATSALDAESEYIVQKALDRAREGRTTIVIAHRLSTIKNADKIVAIRDGQVEEIGTHDELMAKKGLYHTLVNAQVFTDIDDHKRKLEKQTSITSVRSRFSSRGSVGRSTRVEHADINEELNDDDLKSDVKRLEKDLEEEGAKPKNLFAILKYARPEMLFIVIAVVMSLIQGSVFPAFSIVFTRVLEIFASTDLDKVRHDGHFWALMFLVLGAIMGVSLFFQAVFFGLTAERLTFRIRQFLFQNILRQDISYFDQPNHSSGKLCTRLATDCPNVKSAIDYRLGSVFSAVVSITAGIAIGLVYCWQMALLVCAIFPLGGVGQALQAKYFEGKSGEEAKEMENAGKVAMEAIENIRTVQALTLEKRFYYLFESHLENPHNLSIKKAFIQGVTYGFSSSIFFFLYSSAFRFGVFLIVHSSVMPMDVYRTLNAISFSSSSMGFAR